MQQYKIFEEKSNETQTPAVPLITVDPYFSVWSQTERLNAITGIAEIDNDTYVFMGLSDDVIKQQARTMYQRSMEITALSTSYLFVGGGIELTAVFTTPLLLDDLRWTIDKGPAENGDM